MEIPPLHAMFTAQAAASAVSPKLKAAAHQFEASLMQELLKPLQQDPLFAPDSSDSAGGFDSGSDGQGSSGALMSFGSEALAQAISEHGGFGIATKILDHFETEAKSASSVNLGKI